MRPLKSYSSLSEKLYFVFGIDSTGEIYLRYETKTPNYDSFSQYFAEVLQLTHEKVL